MSLWLAALVHVWAFLSIEPNVKSHLGSSCFYVSNKIVRHKCPSSTGEVFFDDAAIQHLGEQGLVYLKGTQIFDRELHHVLYVFPPGRASFVQNE